MSEQAEALDAGPNAIAIFLPVGIGIAIGLNAGRTWAIWGAAAAMVFALSHVVLKSWHFRQYSAAAGADSSLAAYLAMRVVVEALKVGVPIALVFAVRGAPFRIGSASPWPSEAKVLYVAQCSADLVSQGHASIDARATCACIATHLEAEFGLEEYDAMMKVQPRKRGNGVEQRLYHALASCPLSSQ